jgi:hypothetical protein
MNKIIFSKSELDNQASNAGSGESLVYQKWYINVICIGDPHLIIKLIFLIQKGNVSFMSHSFSHFFQLLWNIINIWKIVYKA